MKLKESESDNTPKATSLDALVALPAQHASRQMADALELLLNPNGSCVPFVLVICDCGATVDKAKASELVASANVATSNAALVVCMDMLTNTLKNTLHEKVVTGVIVFGHLSSPLRVLEEVVLHTARRGTLQLVQILDPESV